MKKTFLICCGLMIVSLFFVQTISPVVVSAAGDGGGTSAVTNGGSPGSSSNGGGTSAPCPAGKICNPLKVNTIQDLIAFALKFVVNLLAIAGVMYIIWTGFMFVKAQGNPGELEKAKTAFLHALIGMAIILGAWAIANVIANTINQVTQDNSATFK